MSRRPRSGAAANARISIRVTDAEATQLEALARRAGVNAADLVRSWLQREHAATDYVDQRSATKAPGWFYAKRCPRFVFTLHAVPGRAEPLCVRRPVFECHEQASFEFARGRRSSVTTDELFGRGWDVTDGQSRWIDTADGERRDLDGRTFFDLEPRIVVFAEAPSSEERHLWTARHAREQALLRRVRRDGALTLWRVVLDDQPASAARCDGNQRAVPRINDDEYIERRGDLFVGARHHEPGVDDRRLRVNLFDLAGAGWAWSHGPNFCSGEGEVAWCLEQPSPETLGAIGSSEHAQSVRAARENQRHWREKERQKKAREDEERQRAEELIDEVLGRSTKPPQPVRDALGELGLTWPCTEADVNRAKKRAAREHHPDHGGDEAKMKLAMAAADVVMVWLGRRAA